MDAAVDHGGAGCHADGVFGQDAGGQSEGSAGIEVFFADANQVDLAHELTADSDVEVLFGEVVEFGPFGFAGRGDHGVHRADLLKHPADGRGIGHVHLDIARVSSGNDDLVGFGEMFTDLGSDGTVTAHYQNFHDVLLRGFELLCPLVWERRPSGSNELF